MIRICIRNKWSGFTLIELLVVVGIIGILSSIATVNMLEAQSRGRVARVIADLDALWKALNDYYTMFEDFPPKAKGTHKEIPVGFRVLTTPVDFLSSIPYDIFVRDLPDGRYANRWYRYIPDDVRFPSDKPNVRFAYECWGYYHNAVDQYAEKYNSAFNGWYQGRDVSAAVEFVILSIGPDRNLRGYENGGTPFSPDYSNPYDPTNGIISPGDVSRWGGDKPRE